MKTASLALIFCVVVALCGCGPSALPGPATGPVAEADLIGTWSYTGDYETTRVEIEFKNDHTFLQTVTGPKGEVKVQKGRWSLGGAHVSLDDLLLNESVRGFDSSAWKIGETSWWFTDEAGYLQLYGGENSEDPDQCNPLKRHQKNEDGP